jgi:hypothetical protein
VSDGHVHPDVLRPPELPLLDDPPSSPELDPPSSVLSPLPLDPPDPPPDPPPPLPELALPCGPP